MSQGMDLKAYYWATFVSDKATILLNVKRLKCVCVQFSDIKTVGMLLRVEW
jgi:hypothetical protein